MKLLKSDIGAYVEFLHAGRLVLCVLTLSLCGCGATLIVRQYQPIRAGVVKYLAEGADFVIEKRRASAGKVMQEFCDGPYTILTDSLEGQFSGVYFSGNMAFPMQSNYGYIRFECK